MKLIFLDVDGVMNYEHWYGSDLRKSLSSGGKTRNWSRDFAPDAVNWLNWLTDKTEAKIVLSASCRTDPWSSLVMRFKEVGIKGHLIGRTPKMYFRQEGNSANVSVPRGVEIMAWLKENESIIGCPYSRYKDYVIFDDDGDMLLWQQANYFRCDPVSGLTHNIVYRAELYLNKHEL